jgi:hypothetical protein
MASSQERLHTSPTAVKQMADTGDESSAPDLTPSTDADRWRNVTSPDLTRRTDTDAEGSAFDLVSYREP